MLSYELVKSRLDPIVASLLLILISPLLLACSLLVLCTGMPILFRQRRVGKNGKIFVVLKFRTMQPAPFQLCLSHHDSRITWAGRILRTLRFDELPQLINVVRREMSCIGPRPQALEVDHKFAREVPGYTERRNVLPGITGWAKVMQPNSVSGMGTAAHEYDVYYVQTKGLKLDLKILLLTPLAIVRGMRFTEKSCGIQSKERTYTHVSS